MIQYDAIVIGTGQSGPSLAKRLAGAGMKVAIIERAAFGGTCINTGCTPTKTLVASAYAAHLARRGAEFGVLAQGDISVDMKRVKARKDAVVSAWTAATETSLRETPNCTVLPGARTVRVEPRSRRGRPVAFGRADLHRRGGPSRSYRRSPASIRSAISRTARCWTSISCRTIWLWSAAAISGSNSPRCTGASAAR